MERIYAFTSNWYSDGRSEHSVCQGRRTFVEQFIPRDEFSDLFGGYVLSADSEEEYLGVLESEARAEIPQNTPGARSTV